MTRLTLALCASLLFFVGCDAAAPTDGTVALTAETVAPGDMAAKNGASVGCIQSIGTTVARNSHGEMVTFTGPKRSRQCVINKQNGLLHFTVQLPESLTPGRTERLEAPADYLGCGMSDSDGDFLFTETGWVINRSNGQSKVVCHFRF